MEQSALLNTLLAAVVDKQLEIVANAVDGEEVGVNQFLVWPAKGKEKDTSVQRTLLQVAAHHGCIDILEFLVARGADPNLQSSTDGYTALHCACDGASPRCREAIDMLMKAGGNTELVDHQGKRPVDVLLAAIQASPTAPGQIACGQHVAEEVRTAIAQTRLLLEACFVTLRSFPQGGLSELDKPEYSNDQFRMYSFKVSLA
jgi:hypothetical protein